MHGSNSLIVMVNDWITIPGLLTGVGNCCNGIYYMSAGFALDTCIVSEFAKRANLQDQNLGTWIRGVLPDEIVIPVAAIFEIQCGIQKIALTNPAKSEALGEWLETLLASGFYIQPMTTEIARLHAKMVMTPALKNLWLSPPKSGPQAPGQDLLIAATAIVLGATVVTANTRDFEFIDRYFALPGLLNPLADPQPCIVA